MAESLEVVSRGSELQYLFRFAKVKKEADMDKHRWDCYVLVV